MYSEENFKHFLEFGPDAIIIIDGSGEIVLVNQQTENLFQYSREELLGQKIETLIPKNVHEKHVEERNVYINNPVIRPMGHPGRNLVGRKKDGSEVKVEISLSPVHVKGGALFIISTIRDVSERFKMEKKLVEAQNMFEKIFESSLHGIIKLKSVRDQDGNIVDFTYQLVNKASEAHIKRKREDVLGKKIGELFPLLKENGVFDAYVETVKTGVSRTVEFLYDKNEINAWFKSNIIKEGDGVIASFDDVTARKEYQQNLEKINHELEERVKDRTKELSKTNEKLIYVNQKLDKYAYLISHDLKAPLSNIEGLASMVKADYQGKALDQEGVEMLGMMEAKVHDMKDIITNLLQAAKDEIKDKELVDLYQEAQKAVRTLDPPPHFHIFIQHNLPVVKYQKSSIVQIFQNLIGNSIKYMDKKSPLITVSCKEAEAYYMICVTDNGSGIPEDKLPKVFELFEKAHEGQVKDSHGIGLSIVKQLVEQNGGEVWVESVYGNETKFHFSIPKR
ncbi:PAS domain S-box protein [Cytophagaceae bacterium ABcell3]|nr:PAS domain S-box protein [Cytophagaceae bacterium ABcell3]